MQAWFPFIFGCSKNRYIHCKTMFTCWVSLFCNGFTLGPRAQATLMKNKFNLFLYYHKGFFIYKLCVWIFFFQKMIIKMLFNKKNSNIFLLKWIYLFFKKIIIIMYIIERTLWIKFASCWGWIVYLCAFGCEYFFCVQYTVFL